MEKLKTVAFSFIAGIFFSSLIWMWQMNNATKEPQELIVILTTNNILASFAPVWIENTKPPRQKATAFTDTNGFAYFYNLPDDTYTLGTDIKECARQTETIAVNKDNRSAVLSCSILFQK